MNVVLDNYEVQFWEETKFLTVLGNSYHQYSERKAKLDKFFRGWFATS